MKKKKSTQNLLGLETFGKFGLCVNKEELVFFSCPADQYLGTVSRAYGRKNLSADAASELCAKAGNYRIG